MRIKRKGMPVAERMSSKVKSHEAQSSKHSKELLNTNCKKMNDLI